MPTVMITGAGRGLGLEMARQYVAEGWQVIGTVRDPDRAAELAALASGAGDRVRIERLDVTDHARIDALAGQPDGVVEVKTAQLGPTIIVKVIVGILFFLAGAISVICNWILGLPHVRWTFWNNMREGRLCLRQAYIYSTADDITNVQQLEDLIENRKEFSNVSVLKFEDSKHVLHMMKHPKSYERMIDDFLRDTRLA